MKFMLLAIVLVIYTCFMLTIAYAKAKHDNSQFRLRIKESKVDQVIVHIYGAFLVILPVMLFSIICWGLTLLALKFTLVSLSIYWIVFELLLNKFEGKPLLEVGKTWMVDAWVRKLAIKYDVEEEKLMMVFKLLFLAFSLWIPIGI